MEDKLLMCIQNHNLINKSKTALIGVSGGPDSMALLHFFKERRKEWDLHITAITIDHQLRDEESEKDVHYVRTMCEKWNIPFVSTSVDVIAYKQLKKVSTQVAARELRYEAFKKHMKLLQGDYLVLGHHGDDQIETMIMSLARTTSLSSFTGIPIKRELRQGEIIRPLLCVTKSEIEDYCLKHKIEPRIDATNLDTYYTRNYVRAYIVPKLKERNNSLHITMQRLSETLQEDESYLMNEAEKVLKKAVQFDEKSKSVRLSIDVLKHHAISLQRRVYRLVLDYLYDELPGNLSYTHEHIFLTLMKEKSNNQVVHFPKQLFIERSYGNILFYFHEDQPKNETFHHLITDIPTNISLSNGAALSVKSVDEKEAYERESDPYTYVCPVNHISFPIHIRTRKDGDRMSYEGLHGTKKIKDIFIDAKIPRHERDDIYIVTDESNEIYWLIGIRKNTINDNVSDCLYLLFEYQPKKTEGGK